MSDSQKIESRNFIGGMNGDTAGRLVPSGMYVDAYHIEIESFGGKPTGFIKNLKGNTLVAYELPSGLNDVQYSLQDGENRRAYYFVMNSDGKHSILEYDGNSNSITKILESKTDSGGVDILNMTDEFPVRRAAIQDGQDLIWTDGNQEIFSINIPFAKSGGYGTYLPEYISLYKSPPRLCPILSFASDSTLGYNKLYKNQFKASYRYIYFNNQPSTWSDYTPVSFLPDEAEIDNDFIQNNNNVLNIQITTGNITVKKIEIAIQINGGQFAQVKLLDKAKEGIADNASFTYAFFNNAIYAGIDEEQIVKPYDFIPKSVSSVDLANNSILMVSNCKEGFNDVAVDASIEVDYVDADLNGGPNFNVPTFTSVFSNYDSHGAHQIDATIGASVLAGNVFTWVGIGLNLSYTANGNDTQTTVRQYFYNQLIYYYGGSIPGNAVLTISLIGAGTIRVSHSSFYFDGIVTNAVPGSRPGTSIQSLKGGCQYKAFIEYEDAKGRKTLGYTSEALAFHTDLVIKDDQKPIATMTINHQAPEEFVYWQVLLARLNTTDFLQYISTYSVQNSETGNYEIQFDGITAYQKINPNTNVIFNFEKGDRVRFMGYYDPSDVYTAFTDVEECEILENATGRIEQVNSKIKANGSNVIDVVRNEASDVGKQIAYGDVVRRIVSIAAGGTLGTQYTLDQVVDGTDTFNGYQLITDQPRIIIAPPSVTASQRYFMEIYKGSEIVDNLFCYEIGLKFPIINGKHGGNTQSQTDTDPAIITIDHADCYIRDRQMPTKGEFDFDILTHAVESFHASDFYDSNENDFGRPNTEYDGSTEQVYDRIRYSNSSIAQTKINKLNVFDNTDRKDFSDKYGPIQLINSIGDDLYFFKDLKVGHLGISKAYINQAEGQDQIVGQSSNVLSDPIFYGFNGGIGQFFSSYAQGVYAQYFICPQTKSLCQVQNAGVQEISKIFHQGRFFEEQITQAIESNFKIVSGYDLKKNRVYVAFKNGSVVINSDSFAASGWRTRSEGYVDSNSITQTLAPTKGSTSISPLGIATYTSNGIDDGADSFKFTAEDESGDLYPERRICITVVPRPTGWVGIDPTCVLSDGENTGWVHYQNKQLYYTDETGGAVSPPVITDNNDYAVADYQDETMCPLAIAGDVYYLRAAIDRDNSGFNHITIGFTVTSDNPALYGIEISIDATLTYKDVDGVLHTEPVLTTIPVNQNFRNVTVTLADIPDFSFGFFARVCFNSATPLTNSGNLLSVQPYC